MKKILSTLILVALTSGLVHAQEYKLAKTTGTLAIKEVNSVVIEGTTGNEIIFVNKDHSNEKDERAEGLKVVSGYGLEDNTNIGLSVVEKNGVIEVRQLKKMDGPEIVIKVPKGITVSYSHTSPYGNDFEIKNFEGEIEVSTLHNGVTITNSTGPMTVKTVHGDIEAKLPATIKNPISIVSVHGHVDVALPAGFKANLKLGTVYGELYLDPDFKIESDHKEGDDLVVHSSNVSGKLNGGGIEISLSSTHNNVYLRKNK
jgi:predicted membrane protein